MGDIPSWLPHASGRFFGGFEGLSEEAHATKLYDVASKYYETITKHVRSHDPNHLILGDRYNGNKGIPTAALRAMKPFVDVLSIQYFSGPTMGDHIAMRNAFAEWQAITEKPVLNADLGNWTATSSPKPQYRPVLTGRAPSRTMFEIAGPRMISRSPCSSWH